VSRLCGGFGALFLCPIWADPSGSRPVMIEHVHLFLMESAFMARTTRSFTFRLLAPIAAVALCAPALAQPSDGVLREGSGPRREKLNSMESKPLPPEVWSAITDYRNGEPLNAENTRGKVVMFVTWASWFPSSTRVLAEVEEMHKRFERSGLVVVGVHNKRGWGDRATETASREGVTFRHGVDAGAFAEILHVDNDPDFYLVDRAGQLRFADIPTGEVSKALAILLSEGADDASTRNERLAAERAAAQRQARFSTGINEDLDLLRVPLDLPFTRPSPTAYTGAAWPEIYIESQFGGERERMPTWQAAVPAAGWVGDRPHTDGRVTVLYLWHPYIYDSYFRTMPMIDRSITIVHGRDVAVAGLLTAFTDELRGQNTSGTGGIPPALDRLINDPMYLDGIVRGIVREQSPRHPLIVDPSGAQYDALVAGRSNEYGTGRQEELTLPWGFIISSDGFVRYYGAINDDFRAVLRTVIEVDPGVAARREAEQAFIRRNRADRP